jgi:hypothetical protein
MAFYDAFFGSDQSLYTAYAIMAAIIAICITILLTATDISVGNRILIVLFVVITLVPSIFLTLFEITCMVTGGTEPNRWWCYAFAWILAAFVIIYCVFVVIISLISLFTYNNAMDNVTQAEKKNKLSDTDTNHIAKEIIKSDEENKNRENFYLMPDENEQFSNWLAVRQNSCLRSGMVYNQRTGRCEIALKIPDPKPAAKQTSQAAPAQTNYAYNHCITDSGCSARYAWNRPKNCCNLVGTNYFVPTYALANQGFENRENFGAEPMDDELTPPVSIPPQNENEDFSNNNNNEDFSNNNNEDFSNNNNGDFLNNNEGFKSYDGNNKNYFSDFTPAGVTNLLSEIKKTPNPFSSFGNLI